MARNFNGNVNLPVAKGSRGGAIAGNILGKLGEAALGMSRQRQMVANESFREQNRRDRITHQANENIRVSGARRLDREAVLKTEADWTALRTSQPGTNPSGGPLNKQTAVSMVKNNAISHEMALQQSPGYQRSFQRHTGSGGDMDSFLAMHTASGLPSTSKASRSARATTAGMGSRTSTFTQSTPEGSSPSTPASSGPSPITSTSSSGTSDQVKDDAGLGNS